MNKKYFCFFALIVSLYSFSAWAFEIKIASLAPEGSTWMKVLNEINAALKQETQGAVSLQIYPGGTMGDEQDVFRKMQIGQLQAAGFTGRGLGAILPEIRVMELPFLYQNYTQVKKVREALADQFEKGFQKKGFVLLGWTENGFVYIFSQKPVRSEQDLKKTKMWSWAGDPLVSKLYEVFQVTPVSLSIADVLTSLQTGLVEAAYAPPLAAAALQWFTATNYVTDLPLAHATGAILISNAAWQQLTAPQQAIVMRVFKKYADQLNQQIQKDNDDALQVLVQSGMKKVVVADAEKKAIQDKALQVRQALVGHLYSKELLANVEALLKP